jgi:hypothetical protein
MFNTSTNEFIISRPGAGRDAQQVRNRAALGGREFDGLGEIDGIIRSSAAFDLRESERPSIVGQRGSDAGVFPVGVSPLTGIREYALTDEAITAGRFDFTRADLLDPVPLDNVGNQPVDPGAQDFGLVPMDPTDRDPRDQDAEDERGRASTHAMLMDRLRERLATQGMLEGIEQAQQQAVDDPQAQGRIIDPRATLEADEEDEEPTDLTDQLLRRLSDLLSEDADPLPGEPDAPRTPRTLEELLEDARERQIRKALGLLDKETASVFEAVEVDDFLEVFDLLQDEAPTDLVFEQTDQAGEARSAYEDRMADGERALREGMWFDAEEFFAAAMVAEAGDGMAAMGRIAAQTGGGLFRSAATGIRQTARAYPELAPSTLDRGLLPSGERLTQVMQDLRTIMERRDAATLDASLVLAWLGHQLGDESLVSEGFDAIQSVSEEADIPMRPIDLALNRLWTTD